MGGLVRDQIGFGTSTVSANVLLHAEGWVIIQELLFAP